MTFLLRKKKRGKRISIIEIGLILCGIYLIISTSILGGILLVLAGVISILSKKQETFTVNENEIVWSGMFSKKYEWQEIENIILKDGLLTIDLKNNRLIQGEVEYDDEEIKFNEFCKTHLTNNAEDAG